MTKNSSNSSKGKSGNTRQISPAKHWVFTLNNHTQMNIDFIMQCSSIDQLSMQEETGEQGTPHLQGYIKFKTKLRPLSVFRSSSIAAKAHWEKCKNISAAIEYTQKAETRTGRQFVKGLRIVRPLKVLKREQLYPWQSKIVDMIETEPDDRTINWFWEDTGSIGKSALVRYLVINHSALLVAGKGADIKFLICGQKQPPDIIIYDIPRTAERYVDYCALEEIKNGLFCSSKYESKMYVMNSPHILCFANFGPDFEALSEDRWNIVKL